MMPKRVLVRAGDNSREVTISSDEDEALKHGHSAQGRGVLQPAQSIPDRSVLNVVKLQKQVHNLSCQLLILA